MGEGKRHERETLSLAILDVMLPDMDGFTLCQKIRETHFFPIIMLTAKVEDMDKITGLTLGADVTALRRMRCFVPTCKVFPIRWRNRHSLTEPVI